MATSGKRYVSQEGNGALAAASGAVEHEYKLYLLVYDIPSENIQYLHSDPKINKERQKKLKSMRNKLYYYLKNVGAQRVSESEWVLPQFDTADAMDGFISYLEDSYIEPYVERYDEWGLFSIFSWYTIKTNEVGLMTKNAQVLKNLYFGVERILESVARGLRFNENYRNNTTFKDNKAVFGDTEKRQLLTMAKVKGWLKKFTSYADVLDDFLTPEAATIAQLGSLKTVREHMDNCANIIEEAKAKVEAYIKAVRA